MRTRRTGRDPGSTLVLTLILTVVMGTIVLAIAGYATAGLRASGVTTDRILSNADASNAASWVVEEFAKRTIDPSDVCTDAALYSEYAEISIPASVVRNGTTVTARCGRATDFEIYRTYHLVVESHGLQTRTVEALVEVPYYAAGAWVAESRDRH